MHTQDVHTVVLGAGPAGLAAAYTLARAGHRPVLVDRDKVPGGLMRSIRRGDFVVDVGRKELYNRLERVDGFWDAILKGDYRQYPHRGGYLYDGHILEMSRGPRGFRRGMPWPLFLGCMSGFLLGRLNVFAARPRTVEEYFYRTRGRLLTRVASQGFQEKLTGTRWADMPLPDGCDAAGESSFVDTLRAAATRAFTTKEVNTFKGTWRHPSRGTGQICDALAAGTTEAGGTLVLNAKILELKTDGGNRVNGVVVQVGDETTCYHPQHLISSIPLEVLITLVGGRVPEAYKAAAGAPARKRTVVLVYLFLDRPPRFPHAWLQVTCPKTRIGRITNYAGFEGEMVPAGKGCLCCEYYCYGPDPFLDMDPKQLVRETFDYCVSSGLADAGSLQDDLVLKLPGADASQNRHNWMTSLRLGLLDEIEPFHNLYHVGRTDLDIATLAGMEAAEAVCSGDRRAFDRHFDPEALGIRSDPKAFEFKLPQARAALAAKRATAHPS